VHAQIVNAGRLWNGLEQHSTLTGRLCPTCPKAALFVSVFGDHELDWCLECHGIYFDVGELKKIRSALETRKSGVFSTTANVGKEVVTEVGGIILIEVIFEAIGSLIAQIGEVV
jgi:Zn-finger nucleic acid-binding protein